MPAILAQSDRNNHRLTVDFLNRTAELCPGIKPVSAIDVLPSTNGPNLVESYVMQIFRGDSIMPSSFNERYFSCLVLSLSSIEIDLSRSFKKELLTRRLDESSLIKMKFHGCENPTDGA